MPACSALKEAVELALRIFAVSTRDQMQTSIMAEAVKKQLAQFFLILREYRSHEAAALLLESLREQLRSAQQTADALERSGISSTAILTHHSST